MFHSIVSPCPAAFRRRVAVLVLSCCGACTAAAQVPHLINYQGRVTVAAQNFDGPGAFKFALTNSGGATAYWLNSGAPGPLIEPPDAVTLPVKKGVFSVSLGDTALTNMQAIPASVFADHSAVYLRVWFNDGTHGFQALQPDQRIAAVGYAVVAETVTDGAITSAKMAPGAARENLDASGQSGVASHGSIVSELYNDTTLLNAGYVVDGVLETGAKDSWRQLPSAPEGRRSHTAVPWNTVSGVLVWGGYRMNGASEELTNAGLRYGTFNDAWSPMATANAPAARTLHTAVATGSQMIVWGGKGAAVDYLGDGGIYTPSSDLWQPIPASGLITARRYHSAVFASGLMIVWGGELSNGVYAGTGARFNPATGVWTQTAIGIGAPTSRAAHTAVVSGGKMIVWGGLTAGGATNTGSAYDIANNTWTAISTVNAPTARQAHQATTDFSGRMFVWGGLGVGGALNDGGIYDPATNSWTAMSAAGAPTARTGNTFTYHGSGMLVWGGSAGGAPLADGKVFDFSNNLWKAMESIGNPPAREAHTATWIGSAGTFVFGGRSGGTMLSDLWVWKPRRTLYLYTRP